MKKSGMAGLLKQAQKLQEDMAQVQSELENLVVEASSGGGVVTATATGKQEIISIKLDPEVVDPKETEMLEDLVVAAVNQALKKSREMADEKMSQVAGGLMGGLPGGFKLPGF
jgi:nucleoid-associated protein EbfC